MLKYMAQPLLIPCPENATIQELKPVSRISSSETATRCTAFHGYISGAYQIECSYETVVRFFHKQGYALKMPHGIEKFRLNGMVGNQNICHHIRQILILSKEFGLQ